MLLGAEWKPEVQAFVKIEHEQSHEGDGFVWPAPTFRFFTREGKEIEGRDKARKMKFARASVPHFNVPDFRNKPQVVPGPMTTATEISRRMELANKRTEQFLDKATEDMAKQMAKNIDDHLLDSLMYGSMAWKTDEDDGIAIKSQHDLKIMRPDNIWKTKFVA